MPTVPFTSKLVTHPANSPRSVPGHWEVTVAQSRNDGQVSYVGLGELDTDPNAKMGCGAFIGYNDLYSMNVEDVEEVSVDCEMPATMGPGDTVEGTITYPDSWKGANIHAVYVFDDGPTEIAFQLEAIVVGPFVVPSPLGNVGGQDYHATRVRSTGSFDFLFAVDQYTAFLDFWNEYIERLSSDRTLYFDWAGAAGTALVGSDAYADPADPVGVSHIFPTAGSACSCHAIDEFGQQSPTLTLWLPPICKATLVSSDSPLFYFDFSTSYDPDSTVATPSIPGPPNDEGLYVLDLTSTAEGLSEDLNLNYTVLVSDNRTPVPLTDALKIPLVVEPLGFIGAHIDHTRTLYTAVNGVTGITVYRWPQGAASRVVAGTIAGYKFPSLWGTQSGVFYCSGKSSSTGQYHVFRSYNRGQSWQQITISTMWGTNYKKGIDCGVPVGGGSASVALFTVDSNTQKLLFKYSPDGATWPADAEAIEIATLTGADRIKNAQVRQVPGSIEFRVTDGAAKIWNSFKMGAANSWNLIP